MADQINDGGPAFPTEIGPGPDGGFQCGNERWHEPGMALRDYFAAQAMQGMLVGGHWPDSSEIVETARRAYLMADAMLKARSA